MILLITGATHTGKTHLAQKLLETLHYPYLSEDHLKMGLIRSGHTDLTPADDDRMTAFLWPIVREVIKTAIENRQDLIVEGCYVPFDWKKDFPEPYLSQIRCICLCLSDGYIEGHFDAIRENACCIEARLDDSYCTPALLKRENRAFEAGCRANGLEVLLIEKDYEETIRRFLLQEVSCSLEKTAL